MAKLRFSLFKGKKFVSQYKNEFLIFIYRYSTAGVYKIAVNVSNLVSNMSKESTVTVIKVATFLIINAKSSADALSSGSFSSKSGDAFPFEFPVLFEVEQDGDPNRDVSFYFYFGDGSIFNATSTEVSGTHTYPSTGEYTVTVTLKHKFGELTNSTRITMKESVTGLKISDDAPTVVNEVTTFTVTWDTLGTDSFIEINFGDREKIHFGDGVNNVDSSSQNITFGHIYTDLNVFDIEVKGWNDVSSMRFTHRIVTVEEECRYPDPLILGVGPDPQRALNFTKGKENIVYARIVINCKASYETVFQWKVYLHTCDDSENKSTPIMINTDINKASLTIPPYSLPNGAICLEFQAKMRYVIDAIETYAYGYLNVLPGKLRAVILGGNVRTVSSQRPTTIDGSVSEDSDIKGGNFSGIQFYWFCRRLNESFPQGVEELPPVSLENSSLNSAVKGCEGSGPRMLNYSTSVWRISPGALTENEMYVVKLVIRKDVREAIFEQTIQVVQGVPPDVAIG